MQTLLQGPGRGRAPEPNPDEVPAPATGAFPIKRITQVSLVVADVVMVIIAGMLLLSGPLTAGRVLLVTGAIGLGAWLTCLAFWQD
jgi:hypothetical protein